MHNRACAAEQTNILQYEKSLRFEGARANFVKQKIPISQLLSGLNQTKKGGKH